MLRCIWSVIVCTFLITACGGSDSPPVIANTPPLLKQSAVSGITFQGVTFDAKMVSSIISDDNISSVSIDLLSTSSPGFDVAISDSGYASFIAYQAGVYEIDASASDGEYQIDFTLSIEVTESSCVANFTGKNIILSYDDSPLSDYDFVLPVHLDLGIPGEIGVNTDRIFEVSNNDKHLTVNQLLEIKQGGFEMLSHGAAHQPLSTTTLLRDAASGENTVHTNLDSLYRNAWKTSYEWILSGPDSSESIDIITNRSSDKGPYIELVMPLLNSFPAYSVFVPSETGMNIEMKQSLDVLEEYDLGGKHISYPFGLSDDRTVEYARRYGYVTGRDAVPHINRFEVDTLYIDSIGNPFEINSLDFAYLSEDFIKEQLNRSAEPNQFIIFFSHSWDQNLTADKIRSLAKIALESGFSFTTRSESLTVSCS